MTSNSWIRAGLLALSFLVANPAASEIRDTASQEAAIEDARLALKAGDRDAAMAALERAVASGFYGLQDLIRQTDFIELRIASGMSALLDQSEALRPRPVVMRSDDDAKLPLTSDDLIWNKTTERFEVELNLTASHDLPLLQTLDGLPPDLQHLHNLHEAGQACGLQGVLYDNRDRGHSRFNHRLFPQLTRSFYDKPLHERSLDYGLNSRVLFTTPTFGNSSTMYRGLTGRALPRYAMTYAGQAAQAFTNYDNNHIYVYPGGAEAFPANWPYTLTSRGMSGSDQWILRAVALIIAALPCETRDFAEIHRLIAPTVQMVFRRAQSDINSRADYMSGAAHPMIFEEGATNLIAMMDLAASLTADELPPMVRMEVTEESFSTKAGLMGRSERLYDTPSAIARVWRGFEGQHRMLVDTRATAAPNGRDLEMSFKLLRGDPTRVRIEKVSPTQAEITIDWHDDIPLNADRGRRVDIGVFASNGSHDSAPGFISVLFPEHQSRQYTRGAGGVPRLVSVNYNTSRRFDPVLFWRADWEDVYGYDAAGKTTGWMRLQGEERKRFEANGRREDGQKITYRLQQLDKELPVLVERPAR